MKTKSTFLFAIFFVLQMAAQSQPCANLFFSEYLEGASNNKAIEVYNPTANVISLTDYVIYRYNNGSPTPTDSLLMQGTIAPGGVYVAGNPSAIAAIISVSDTLHTITFFNGDDAMALFQKSTQTQLDVIGVIGFDPGTNWVVGTGATSEFTLVRNVNINMGDVNWATAVSGWDVYPQNTTTYIGNHTITPCCFTSNASINIAQCESFVSPSGLYTYTVSGVYLDTINNAAGCDSIITINLTINNPSSFSQALTICQGQSCSVGTHVYTVSGVYSDTLSTVHGCDSIVATDLTVLPVSASNQNINLCAGQTLAVGTSIYDTTGTYVDIFVAINGCDSTVTTNLLVEDTIDITTTLIGDSIIANQAGASYQWLDCDNANTPMAGETGQSFTATSNGNFSVVVTINACSDTSACVNVTSVGINDTGVTKNFTVSPNPNNGSFVVETNAGATIEIFNSIGTLVFVTTANSDKTTIDITSLNNGIYNIKVSSETGINLSKIVKQ